MLGFHLTQYKILVLMPVVLALVPVLVACLSESSAGAWFASGVSVAIVAGAAVVASQTPAYAANHPRGLNVIYYDEKGAKPRWLIGFIGAPDEAFLSAQGFPPQSETYKQLGLGPEDRGRFKPAADLHLAAPTLIVREVTSVSGASVVHGTLHSGRGGFVMGIGVAPHSGIRSLRFDGQEVLSPEKLDGTDAVITRFWGFGSREVPVEITSDATATPKVLLYELSPLPESPEGRALAAGRPNDATPAYRGDSAVVFTSVDLKAARSDSPSTP